MKMLGNYLSRVGCDQIRPKQFLRVLQNVQKLHFLIKMTLDLGHSPDLRVASLIASSYTCMGFVVSAASISLSLQASSIS